ncbi:MAG: hypothetical protein IJ446_01200 [Oscillospiraceae bacterium]|nr:hypothetical protein [Oscillospiraceae bacterium]
MRCAKRKGIAVIAVFSALLMGGCSAVPIEEIPPEPAAEETEMVMTELPEETGEPETEYTTKVTEVTTVTVSEESTETDEEQTELAVAEADYAYNNGYQAEYRPVVTKKVIRKVKKNRSDETTAAETRETERFTSAWEADDGYYEFVEAEYDEEFDEDFFEEVEISYYEEETEVTSVPEVIEETVTETAEETEASAETVTEAATETEAKVTSGNIFAGRKKSDDETSSETRKNNWLITR